MINQPACKIMACGSSIKPRWELAAVGRELKPRRASSGGLQRPGLNFYSRAAKGNMMEALLLKQEVGSKNCMQCASAYMLGLPICDVPDFERAGSEAWESFEEFFFERGFTVEMFPPTVEIGGDYLASGSTERGTNHMVVMRGGKLLYDPHPSNAGLSSVQVVWIIARRAGLGFGEFQGA